MPADHWYLNEPEPVLGSGFMWTAYRDLSTCRRDYDGPIPWDAAALYAERKGLDEDVAELMWSVVHKMDLAERAWMAENAAQAPPQKPKVDERETEQGDA